MGGTLINVASGNALVRTRDLADGALTYHVVVDRAYNSLSPDAFTILSPRWGFDVGPDTKLTVESNQDATVRGPSGYRIRFARQSDGSYVAPAGFDGTLVKTPIGWTLTRTSQSDEFGFDGSGNLTWTKDSSLRDFTVQGTSAAGRTVLSSYGTASGRRVNLSYTGDSLVRLMDDPASGHHSYRYTSGRLTEYESPLGQITSYGYDSNGFLDEIVEPGGTTVELDVLSSGKIGSITTTLPGGVPQTTSFVYTRRTYKTDVTAPDTTRRTYAYDDDWRVTRDYDPDVVPTVTASGELRDLEDDYVGPNQTYALTVAADQPDGAGLRRLLVERENGDEIEGEVVPCTTTPFDLICPTQHTTNLDVSFVNVPEGEQTIHAAATDDEEHHETSADWKVLVDKTPPTAASDFQLSYFDPSDPAASATITWDLPSDPDLPGDLSGSGVAKTEARYRVGVGAFSAWMASDDPVGNDDGQDEVGDGDLAFFGGQNGQLITVEVRVTDAVGNVSAVASGTVTLSEQFEDPDIQEMAAEYYVDEYGGTLSIAREWLDVQRQATGMGPAVSAALPSGGYAGIWFDNDSRRIKIGLRSGTPAAPASQVIADRNLAASTDLIFTNHTQRQLEEAKPEVTDALQGFRGQGLIAVFRDVAQNRITIELANGVTSAQRAQIQAVADASSVEVALVDSGKDSLAVQSSACKFPYCDGPMRGGVGIGPGADKDSYRRECTSGFASRRGNDRYVLTAGHCLTDTVGGVWGTKEAPERLNGPSTWSKIGYVSSGPVFGLPGDAGTIRVQDSWFANSPRNVRPILYLNRSTTGSVSRVTNYAIRAVANRTPGFGGSAKGNIVCMNGSTNGSRCMTIADVDELRDFVGGETVDHLARAKACGATKGDSGGPVFKDRVAYGIVSAIPGEKGACEVFYQGAAGAENLTDTRIMLRR